MWTSGRVWPYRHALGDRETAKPHLSCKYHTVVINTAQYAVSCLPIRVAVSRAVEAVLRRSIRAIDVAMHRLYGWRGNPLHQSGALAAWMLVVLTVTGVYLLLVYRVASPAASVQRLAADPWLGGWIRTVHRYATDLFIIAAVVHAARIAAQARGWGPRTRAWITGVFLLGVGLACAWTGFVMAWDSFGMRLAMEGARLFDVLPVLSEPVSRIFAGDRPVPQVFFFLNLFVHIALPLAMGAGLWLHVSQVARPVLAPPRPITRNVTVLLVALAVVRPAPLGPAADPLALPASTPLNLLSTWWLPITEQLAPWVVWGAVLSLGVAVLLMPRFARRPRTGALAPSVVDPRLCTGCNQCPQDCPWEAITMVPRDDDRPTLVARVDPTRCVSCGICAASCAPMGVGPPGRSGRDQLAQIRELITADHGRDPRGAPVVVVRCGQSSPLLREQVIAAGATLHEVPCVGTVHSSVVELLIRQGAAGVMIAGCPPRDCTGREGPKWLEQRLYHDREAELQSRVDRRRVCVVTAATGLEREVLTALTAFRAEVSALDSGREGPTADLADLVEVECAAGAEESRP
jgi:ferredoxin